MEQEPNKVREASAVYMTPDMRRQERAVRRLVRAAVLEHKRAGNPVCELQDGKVVWIQPEDIDLPEIPDDDDLEPTDHMPS